MVIIIGGTLCQQDRINFESSELQTVEGNVQ